MTNFHFVDASEVERATPLMIALTGLTGAGKTYSALYLAQRIAQARGGPVIFGDSDNRRALDYDEPEYTHLRPFKYTEILLPYSSEDYREMIEQADKLKPGCIVIDTGSDEWEYVLDEKDRVAEDLATKWKTTPEKTSTPAWAKVKPPHKRFIRAMTKLSAPIIVCFRSDLTNPVDKAGKPLEQIVKPVADSRIFHQFRFVIHMTQYSKGKYTDAFKFYEHEEHIFPKGGTINKACADRLVEHFFSGKSPAEKTTAQAEAPKQEPTAAAPQDESARQAPGGTQANGNPWKLDSQGRFQCQGDPKTTEAKRALFAAIKQVLDPGKNRSLAQKNVSQIILDNNKDLIGELPQTGRQEIDRMYLAIHSKAREE